MIDISSEVKGLIPGNMDNGLCHVFSSHTTAGITVNENADPDVTHDILVMLDRIVPKQDQIYRHSEGNSDAHIKTSLTGVSQMIPIKDGKLNLGTWQGIYFCEFDGPRQRTVHVNFI